MDPLQVNRARWDELAQLHGQDAYYDVAAFLEGASSLHDHELDAVAAAVGPVAGLDLLHIQCHFGLDSLSWARLGARVTGVDFSPAAIARARGLAALAGLDAEFVVADAQRLPESLRARFDLAFASYGVFCWIADIGAWMRSALAALRPHGRLVVIDIHPVCAMFDSVEPLVVDFPYQGGEPVTFSAPGSYAVPDAQTVANETVEYAHGLGEVVDAAIGAGFEVVSLTEFLDEEFGARGGVLVRGDDGRYRLPFGGQHLPVTFSLTARRPANGV